jgi:hypothetical protein
MSLANFSLSSYRLTSQYGKAPSEGDSLKLQNFGVYYKIHAGELPIFLINNIRGFNVQL